MCTTNILSLIEYDIENENKTNVKIEMSYIFIKLIRRKYAWIPNPWRFMEKHIFSHKDANFMIDIIEEIKLTNTIVLLYSYICNHLENVWNHEIRIEERFSRLYDDKHRSIKYFKWICEKKRNIMKLNKKKTKESELNEENSIRLFYSFLDRMK